MRKARGRLDMAMVLSASHLLACIVAIVIELIKMLV